MVSQQTVSDVFNAAVQASGESRHAEAEAGFRSVLALEPDHAEALFGLGITLMTVRRFNESVEPLRRASASPEADTVWWVCLGQALYLTGDFAGSAEAFDKAERLGELADNPRLTRARSRALAAMIKGVPVNVALARYADQAGVLVEDEMVVAREAVAIFSAFDQLDAARAVGAWLAARDPDDVVHAYAMRVLTDTSVDRAPADYVAAKFDGFADHFDHQLVNLLDYQAPAQLAEMIARHITQAADILDLGCGTGLAAEPLAQFGGRLTGVDLSSGMLAKAAERNVYAQLVQADIVDLLRQQPKAFDLVMAADVLIYLGDLADLFEALAGALRPGGYFAFSVEVAAEGWKVLPSGRFAHADSYVRDLAANGFEVLEHEVTTLRREGAGAASGGLYVMRRF
jgi:predicted TPR repeat methyltransferase